MLASVEHSFGYQFENGEIISIDDQVIHAEIVGGKMGRKLSACVSFFVFLASCSDQQVMWVKPRASPDNFAEDKRSCLIWSHKNSYMGSSNSGSVNYRSLFDACMQARGWHLQRVPND